ncbi:MAG: transposase [Nitrospinae bacterium]|nr:transposase [Nitrospinota bacterium]
MGRPLRIEYAGALYHITSRGNERRKIFRDDTDKITFLNILKDYHDRFGILIHSYILMDNHYHLILETPKGNLLKVMHGINSKYTVYFNKRHKRSGHLFQGRYKAIIVDKDAYLIPLSRYVHLNPARAKIVERPEHYKWSSYNGYIGKRKEDNWVEYSWVLSKFAQNKKKAWQKYKEYTEEGLGLKIESPFKDLLGQVVLGEDEFREKIMGRLEGKQISQEIVERKRFEKRASSEDIVKEVAKTFAVEDKDIRDRGRRENIARSVAIYIMQRYSGISNEEIGRIFGGIHYSAVSKASARLREKLAKDKKLSKLVREVISHVKT